MKKNARLLFILFLIICQSNQSQAQEIVKVGTGEYSTTYLGNDGKLYVTILANPPYIIDFGLTNVTDVDGAQYTSICISNGQVYVVGKTAREEPYTQLFDTTNLGELFRPEKVYGMWQSYLALKGGEIYYWSDGIVPVAYDALNQQNGNGHTVPTKLKMPPGKLFRKLVFGTDHMFSSATLWGIATDNTLWQWDRTHTKPFQVTFGGETKVIDAAFCWGDANRAVLTPTNMYGWCVEGTQYARMLTTGNYGNLKPASIKGVWAKAGCLFPLKEFKGSFTGLRIIDANDNVWASGCFSNGEIGNGIEYNPYRIRGNQWLWNLNVNSNSEDSCLPPTQILGAKMKNLQTNTTLAFYMYGQDMAGNWYSWGRNKSLSLGNGITLSSRDYASYPNNLDIPAPRMVKPLTQSWRVVSPNLGALQPPLANAGVNQYIRTTSTTLYGVGSSQQEGKITGYAWTKISGPDCVITSPSSMNTIVTGMANGSYVFRLTVTNNNLLKAFADVIVQVTELK